MEQTHLQQFNHTLHDQLAQYLVRRDVIDRHLPDAPDIEDRFEGILRAYLPDGVREFNHYPTASLGWMMFIGMAVAHMWDEDWQMYSRFDDLYGSILLKGRGYDAMDEYICQDILKLSKKEEKATSTLVGNTAEMVHNALMHAGFEGGTPDAMQAYMICLHQLYYFGAATELRRLGYHMTEL